MSKCPPIFLLTINRPAHLRRVFKSVLETSRNANSLQAIVIDLD